MIQKTVATGSVIPRKEILIKPQVSGIIREIYVEAGDMVKEGDLIAKVKIIPDMVNLSNAENRVNRAKIDLENSNMDFERNEKLFEQGVIAKAEFQPVEIARKQANEELKAAEDNLQIVKEGVTKAGGTASTTLIRSTIQGMILDVPVKEGNSVIEANNFNEGTTIASIADMGDLIFEGKVDGSEVEKLKTGMQLIMKIGAMETREFTADLEYIAPKGIEENGAIQFQIRAAVKMEPGEFIRAGYSANADIVLDRRDSVLTIAESLVQYDDSQKAFVEVLVSEGTYERHDVQLGLSDGMTVEVLGGVSSGDKIKLWNQPVKEE
ncbi:MAG: efflux RND transporter periplasmic adaptor subunit [Flavobacteriales bacterium]|nr:efflux RND transporter periplasmic adaptor subunit [Flavobacteriales bacterium]